MTSDDAIHCLTHQVAEQAERRKQQTLSSLGGGDGATLLPSDQAEQCTFHPQITLSAHARKGRTCEERSMGAEGHRG
jgi:hypothetical protein